ncbi:MAG: molybdopterin-binding/glycosyltransferase family 2 protein [Alphaproteobacteria bacterium]|nr:molybdopterin-binding/glycosyltransferase family 2 protein [Alphaproteobacteria bacterium]
MIFAQFRTEDAEGLLLAHSLRLPDRMLKKGRVLTADDVAALRAERIHMVVAVRLEPDDLGEDEAAAAIGRAISGPDILLRTPFTGRCNLLAGGPGLAVLDRQRLERLNMVDEAVTIATLPPFEPVEAGQLIATVKIIPFAVDRRIIEASVAFAAGGGPLIRVESFRPHRVGLILTELPGTRAVLLDEMAAVTRGRIEPLGSTLHHQMRVAHDEGAVERAIGRCIAANCTLLLIGGASATVDRRDVVPAGIERAGGVVEHFGMPVDPGNLLLLGKVGAVPVVDMPGCGRSPRLNGLDFVLRRLLANQPIRPRDIMAMGVGGLLKDVPGRPSPREPEDDPAGTAPREPRVAALVLAAGQSRRMGRNKLLIETGGKPLIAWAVDAALDSRAHRVVVVVGHQAEAVREALACRPVTIVENPRHAEGMATSLGAGLGALPADIDGALVCLGDMPAVTGRHLDRLIAAFDPAEGRAICVPLRDGKRGNPVLLARRFFPQMLAIGGDQGAKRLLAEHPEQVFEVVMADDAVLEDVDDPDALDRLPEERR